MNWKVLSIGLLLACAGSESIAQSILNQTTQQANANFNIGGEGVAYRFGTAPAYHATAVDFINWTLSRTLSTGAAARRWTIGFTGLEMGSNSGSDFAIWSYNDGTTILQRPFTIRRENGFVGIGISSPSHKLQIQDGNVLVQNGILQVMNDANTQSFINIGVSSSNRWGLVKRAGNDPSTPNSFSIYEDNSSVIPGSTGIRFHILAGGNTGIGTALPESRLHIVSSGQSMKFGVGANNSGYAFGLGVNDNGINFNNDSQIRGFNFNNGNGRLFTIASNGNVGIGTDNPNGHKLCVNGSGLFTKVVVKTYANWPDFVFEKDYKLQPIEDVMAFVKEHKHLPGIPSAKEVAENGQDVGDMNAKLLQKIEELTLYIAEMKKEIDALKAEKK